MSAATWDDLGPEARVLRDVMRSRAFGAVSGEAGLLIPDRARFAERVLPKFFKAAPGAAPAARRKTMWESFARQMNYYSWFVERGRAGGDAFVCADPAVRHAADFERRLRRRSTQYR